LREDTATGQTGGRCIEGDFAIRKILLSSNLGGSEHFWAMGKNSQIRRHRSGEIKGGERISRRRIHDRSSRQVVVVQFALLAMLIVEFVQMLPAPASAELQLVPSMDLGKVFVKVEIVCVGDIRVASTVVRDGG